LIFINFIIIILIIIIILVISLIHVMEFMKVRRNVFSVKIAVQYVLIIGITTRTIK